MLRRTGWEMPKDRGEDFGLPAECGGGTWRVLSREATGSDLRFRVATEGAKAVGAAAGVGRPLRRPQVAG